MTSAGGDAVWMQRSPLRAFIATTLALTIAFLAILPSESSAAQMSDRDKRIVETGTHIIGAIDKEPPQHHTPSTTQNADIQKLLRKAGPPIGMLDGRLEQFIEKKRQQEASKTKQPTRKDGEASTYDVHEEL